MSKLTSPCAPLPKACSEPLDFKQIQRDKIDPRFVSDYGVGSFFFSFVLGYNEGKLGANKPQDWSALFDTKTFPGKRALYKWPSPGVLELALLADGVPADKLYPLDLDRAFKKLDTIKKDIVWWGGGAQSQQLLASVKRAWVSSGTAGFMPCRKTAHRSA